MSNYKKQEFDFIQRTKSIIKQYETFQINKEEKYEVTLFLNCLVGLFILPQQHWFEFIPEELISNNEWGISESNIIFIRENETKNVKDISRHIRNSITHYSFEVFSNGNNEIDRIVFQDFNPSKVKTFEANIPLREFRTFVDKFCSTLIALMTTQK